MNKILFFWLGMLVWAAAPAQGKEVYLFDLIKQPPYAALWRDTVWNKVPDKKHMNYSWLQTGGTTGAAETVRIGGQDFYFMEACKPHFCGGDYDILVLMNRNKVVALQIYAVPGYVNVLDWGGKRKRVWADNGEKKTRIYGAPTPAERRYLEQQAKERM